MKFWLHRIAVLIAALAWSFPAPTLSAQTLRESEIHGRRGWIIETGRLRVSLVREGGHLAEVRLVSDDPQLAINPFFVPAGGGYIGHMVCFPHYGPASAEERRNGLRGHGEAGAVEWNVTRPAVTNGNRITFYYGADLPLTHYRIERAVSVAAGETIVHVNETVENLASYDRPFNHVQHATFGAPFIEPGKSALDLSGTRALTDPRRTGGDQWLGARECQWPEAPKTDGTTTDLRPFRAVPGGQIYTAVSGDGAEMNWFALSHRELPLLIGYIFSAADHAWISDWQNRPRSGSDNGIARGIEFGNAPFDEGLRRSVERGNLFDIPTFGWIGARQQRQTAFTIFLTEVPRGFTGVEEVRNEAEAIAILERGTKRELRLVRSDR